jgi:hypothetical protein
MAAPPKFAKLFLNLLFVKEKVVSVIFGLFLFVVSVTIRK